MVELLQKYFPFIVVPFLVAGVVYGIFNWLNRTLNEKIKESASFWLLGKVPNLTLPQQAYALTNKIFGNKYLSLRCFLTSALLTYFINFIVFVWVNIRLYEAAVSTPPSIYKGYMDSPFETPILITLFYSVTIVSIVSGYLSLGKALWLLKQAAKFKSTILSAVFVLIDIVLSGAIIAISQRFFSMNWESTDALGAPFHTINDYIADNYFVGATFIFPIFLSGLFTSIWLTIYFFSILTTRFIIFLTKKVGSASKWISIKRIEEEPITMIGELAAVFVFIGMVIYKVIFK